MGYRNKKWLILIAVILIRHPAQAQDMTGAMLEQLAALKGYISTAEKGYHIAEEGLHLVRDLKTGEFNLHRVFFGSLRVVDDGVLENPSVAGAYRLAAAATNAFARAIDSYAGSGWLTPSEMGYIRALQQNTEDRCRDDLEALQVLTTDGELSMTDGERIRKIDVLATGMQERYTRVIAFLTDVAWLIAQRQKVGSYLGTLKKWYGVQ